MADLIKLCTRLHDKVRVAETRDGASFYTLFGTAIQLGVISRRRVYHEAIQYEKDRNAGFLSPFGYSTPTVTAAVDAISSMEVLLSPRPFLFPEAYFFPSFELTCWANQIFYVASNNLLFSLKWYWHLALISQEVCIEGNYPIRIWRWKGYLVQVWFILVLGFR